MNTVLTDEQIMHLWDTRVGDPCESMPLVDSDETAFARAIEQAVLQSAQVQAWKRDAERYRWLRSPASVDILDVQHWDGGVLDGAALDDAIDTEMKGQP